MNMKHRPKTHYNVKNTPFFVYWGGAEIQGQCKWVIDCDDYDLIDELTQHIDQLWVNKQEAQMMATDFWNQYSETGTYKY